MTTLGRLPGQCLLVLGLLTLSWASLGCGSRTELQGAAPCAREGEVRECFGVCGTGTTTCESGFWSSCTIPPAQGPCRDDCGVGVRYCENELWSECFVPPIEQSCENDCGVGIQTCIDETWGECEVERVERSCTFGCGDGTEICEDNAWSVCDAPHPLPPVLLATIRDFRDSHPDFEQNLSFSGIDAGIVGEQLGPDDKPVYLHGSNGTATTNNQFLFDQWYRDAVDDLGQAVNLSTQIELRLTASPSEPDFYIFGNSIVGQNQFFPIDNELFGNFMFGHNYHFTLEASAEFVYREGQVFRFRGDDDLWVFINRKLAIDLGGLHTSARGSVDIDEIAAQTNMVPGERYSLHIFFAERQSFQSNFYIETSIADLGQCQQ